MVFALFNIGSFKSNLIIKEMNASSLLASSFVEQQQHYSANGILNETANNHDYVPFAERAETYIIPVIFAIIFVIGVLGNGTLVLIFARHKNMRNVPNTYILSLALGDLLVILICVPFTSTVYTFDSWPYGLFICKLSEAAKDVSIGVSVFTLTVLSADRFFAIVDPLKKLHSSIGGRRATRFTVLVTGAVWTLSVLLAVPALVFSYLRSFQVNNETSFQVCYPYPERLGSWYPKTAITAKFFVYYSVPLTIIGCFYVLMARHLLRSTRNMPGEAQGQQARQIRARKKVAKTVLTFVMVFALCFFPQHVFMLWFYHDPYSDEHYNQFWHIFRLFGFLMSFINSCVNPIALYFVSGAFRKHFDLYLFRACKTGSKNHPRRRRFRSTAKTTTHTYNSGGGGGMAGGNRKGPTAMRHQDSLTTVPMTIQMNTTTVRKERPLQQRQDNSPLPPEYTVTTLLNGIEPPKTNHVA